MTENERKAIDTLKGMIAEGQYNGADIVPRDDEEELKTAISALEEIQAYWAIGTVEEFKALKENQIPKKPTYDGDGYAPDGTFVWDEWLCPNCNSRYEVDYDDYDYCPNCGQRLDWSE